MMKRIAITGGIGSGKSYVCRLLAQRGIHVYDCDAAAKRLMRNDERLKRRLTALIGPDTYVNGELNKPVVAKFLLASEDNKQAINGVVHPAVIADFYSSELQWMECAILFDAHLEGNVDVIVCVSAPEEVRIRRIMQRDDISAEKAKQWIDAQISQQYVEDHSDFIIINDGVSAMEDQIERLLQSVG